MGTVGTIIAQKIAIQTPSKNTGIQGTNVDPLNVTSVSVKIIKAYVAVMKPHEAIKT